MRRCLRHSYDPVIHSCGNRGEIFKERPNDRHASNASLHRAKFSFRQGRWACVHTQLSIGIIAIFLAVSSGGTQNYFQILFVALYKLFPPLIWRNVHIAPFVQCRMIVHCPVSNVDCAAYRLAPLQWCDFGVVHFTPYFLMSIGILGVSVPMYICIGADSSVQPDAHIYRLINSCGGANYGYISTYKYLPWPAAGVRCKSST